LVGEIAKGLLLGLSLAAPPGPVNALIALRSLRRALRGFMVGLGALSADMTYLTALLLLEGSVPRSFLKPLGLAGALLMLYMGLSALRSHGASTAARLEEFTDSYLRDYLVGLGMGISNPFQAAWWLTAGLTLVANLGYRIVVGFVAGILIWVSSFSRLVSAGKNSPAVTRAVRLFSAATLMAFSAYILFRLAVFGGL